MKRSDNKTKQNEHEENIDNSTIKQKYCLTYKLKSLKDDLKRHQRKIVEYEGRVRKVRNKMANVTAKLAELNLSIDGNGVGKASISTSEEMGQISTESASGTFDDSSDNSSSTDHSCPRIAAAAQHSTLLHSPPPGLNIPVHTQKEKGRFGKDRHAGWVSLIKDPVRNPHMKVNLAEEGFSKKLILPKEVFSSRGLPFYGPNIYSGVGQVKVLGGTDTGICMIHDFERAPRNLFPPSVQLLVDQIISFPFGPVTHLYLPAALAGRSFMINREREYFNFKAYVKRKQEQPTEKLKLDLKVPCFRNLVALLLPLVSRVSISLNGNLKSARSPCAMVVVPRPADVELVHRAMCLILGYFDGSEDILSASLNSGSVNDILSRWQKNPVPPEVVIGDNEIELPMHIGSVNPGYNVEYNTYGKKTCVVKGDILICTPGIASSAIRNKNLLIKNIHSFHFYQFDYVNQGSPLDSIFNFMEEPCYDSSVQRQCVGLCENVIPATTTAFLTRFPVFFPMIENTLIMNLR